MILSKAHKNRISTFLKTLGFIAAVSLLPGCTNLVPANTPKINVVFEDNDRIFFYNQVFTPQRGSDLTLKVGVKKGNRIAGLSYDNYSISGKIAESDSFDYYQITLHEVFYPEKILIETCKNYITNYFWDNDLLISVTETGHEINCNSLGYFDNTKELMKPGFIPYCLSLESNDTSKQLIPFGGRFERNGAEIINLNIEYLPYDDISCFTYEIQNSSIKITGITPAALSDKILVIPEFVENLPVTALDTNLINDNSVTLDLIVLPPSIREICDSAFTDCTIDTLAMFDNISVVSDASFQNCCINRLILNAAEKPAYEQKYYAKFSDKIDYLIANKNNKKIVFVCGSSARFDYDSPAFKEAFPDYEIINMGVYAYSNMLPQIRLIMQYLGPLDIVLSTPEFDSIDMQFCTSNRFDADTFCLLESNYTLLSKLTISDYSGVFDAFSSFQEGRLRLPRFSYTETPDCFDEDTQIVEGSSYNKYGDYVVYRPSNTTEKVFGIKRAFFNKKYFETGATDSINQIYKELQELGCTVLFAYSPRSIKSLSPDSDSHAINELDAYLKETLSVPVITDISSALMSPYYFYGTDNHLSTEGVTIHSENIINALKPYIRSTE